MLEHFSIPIENGRFLEYFPQVPLVFLATQEGHSALAQDPRKRADLLKSENSFWSLCEEFDVDADEMGPTGDDTGVKADFRPTIATLCLTNACNLSCKYCYARGGEDNSVMPWELGKNAIDLILINAAQLKKKEVNLHFHGGGEPTLEEDLLVRLSDYFRKQCKERGLHSHLSIGTNGVLSSSTRDFIVSNMDSVTISVDGLEDQHNQNRPCNQPDINSFREVVKTLDVFAARKLAYGIRVTVTSANIGHLIPFTQWAFETYAPRTIQFEPVMNVGRCRDNEYLSVSDDEFIEQFTALLDLEQGRRGQISYSGMKRAVTKVFCAVCDPNFNVLPDGRVTACLEVMSPDDARSSQFIYGKYDWQSGAYTFDPDAISHLQKMGVEHYASCQSCFAKYQCAGDCPAKRAVHGPLLNTTAGRCRINRELLTRFLLSQLDRCNEPASQLL